MWFLLFTSLRGLDLVSAFERAVGCILFIFAGTWLINTTKPKASSDNRPLMLPYRFPIIGHTIGFFRNSEALIARGREYFGNKSTFAINLLGRTFYVLTDPDDLTAVHANSTVFTARNPILESILVSLGVSPNGAGNIINSPGQKENNGRKSTRKTIFQQVHDLQVRQLAGMDFKLLVHQAVQNVQAQLAPDAMISRLSQDGTTTLSLYRWARETQVRVMQNTFFGARLGQMDNELPKNLLDYSQHIWQGWYHVPKFLRKDYQYGRRIQSTFAEWLGLSPEERGAAWSMEALVQQFKSSGISEEDTCTFLLFSYWGISMNMAHLIFWLLAHIIHEPELLAAIRSETAPAFNSDGELDTFYLVNNCPRLESAWHEALRLYTSVTTTRWVSQDIQLGSRWLQKGHAILFSARQIGFHDERFASTGDPLIFDSERFLDNPKLKHVNCHRPFGGGKFMCTGRRLAKHVHAAFVTTFLRSYDVVLPFPQEFPGVRDNEAAVGVLGSAGDVIFELVSRK